MAGACVLAAMAAAILSDDGTATPEKPAAPVQKPQQLQAAKDALKPVALLVGEWNGSAQPLDREAKRQGKFWREKNRWVWRLTADSVALEWNCEGAPKFRGGRLTWRPLADGETAAGPYRLAAILADGTTVEYSGKLDGTTLELDGPTKDGKQERLSFALLGDNRHAVYHAVRPEGSPRHTRTVQIVQLRAGQQFARGGGGPECIVTGGLGTMKVEHKGVQYYVCCSGCRDAFLEDPEKYIAEAKAKAAKQNE